MVRASGRPRDSPLTGLDAGSTHGGGVRRALGVDGGNGGGAEAAQAATCVGDHGGSVEDARVLTGVDDSAGSITSVGAAVARCLHDPAEQARGDLDVDPDQNIHKSFEERGRAVRQGKRGEEASGHVVFLVRLLGLLTTLSNHRVLLWQTSRREIAGGVGGVETGNLEEASPRWDWASFSGILMALIRQALQRSENPQPQGCKEHKNPSMIILLFASWLQHEDEQQEGEPTARQSNIRLASSSSVARHKRRDPMSLSTAQLICG